MMLNSLPPGLVMIIGALTLPIFRRRSRPLLVLGLPLLVLLLIWSQFLGRISMIQVFDFWLLPVRVEMTGRVFATIFAIMAFAGGLFALAQKKTEELMAAFIYAGSAIGVTMAGDLVTVFIFWEIMAVASSLVILSSGTEKAKKATMRYILAHVFGGCLLLSGIVMYAYDTGSIYFDEMVVDSPATWLMLLGFLVNAAAPPLSAWLADAYPEASFSGTVFLSAFTTKTAVYVLLRGFAGTEFLMYIGVYMACYGIIYALLENDIRRLLSYSIVNQVGFMLCGIGVGTQMAMNGVTAHAFSHIMYKALLLMSAGSVLYMTGKSKFSELGGLFRTMPITAVCGIIGALAMSFPYTAGFISKSMIIQSVADNQFVVVWLFLTAASAGVFLTAGIKYIWFVFFGEDSGIRAEDPPLPMKLAMILMSFGCIVVGIFPNLLYDILPYNVNYEPYTAAHVVNMLQLLVFGGVSFVILYPLLKRTETISLDFDWLYRRLFFRLFTPVFEKGLKINTAVRRTFNSALQAVLENFVKGGNDPLSRALRTAGSVVWIAVLLVMYLLIYYV